MYVSNHLRDMVDAQDLFDELPTRYIYLFILLMDFPLLNQWQGRASHLPSRYLKMTSISFVSAWFKSYVSSACVFIYPFDFVG